MTITTLYTSRLVALPRLVATAAFDAITVANAERKLSTWTLLTPSVALVAKAPTPAGPEHWTLPMRRAKGRLRSPRSSLSFPVEVELVAWSRQRAEIGVRPLRNSVPLTDEYRQRRYLGLATAMAQHLATTLEAVIEVWGYDVVRQATAFVRATVAI